MRVQRDFGLKRPTKPPSKPLSTARQEAKAEALARACTQLYLRQSPERIFIASWRDTSCPILLQQHFMSVSVSSWLGYSARTDASWIAIGTSPGRSGPCTCNTSFEVIFAASASTGLDSRTKIRAAKGRPAMVLILFRIVALVMPAMPSGGRMARWRGAAAHPHAIGRRRRPTMRACARTAGRKRRRGTEFDEARLRDLAVDMAQIAHSAASNT